MLTKVMLMTGFSAVLLFAQHTLAAQQGESISLPLQMEVFEHIQFGKIKANHFVFKKQEVRIDVVGIWLMADGDNTHSSFSTRIKNIELW